MTSTDPNTTVDKRGARVLRREPGVAEIKPRAHVRNRKAAERALAIGVPAALLLIWQLAHHYEWNLLGYWKIDQRFYASPYEIVTSEKLREAEFWRDVWTSTRRMLIGFALGAGAGVFIGLAMGMSRLIRAALDPLLTALYTVPKLALLPLFLTIFGFDERPRVMLIAVTVFFFVWISTMAAIMAVPEGYREAAMSFGVSRWQMFRHVLLPGSLPQIFVGLRIAAGVAVLILIGVELVIPSQGGIGSLIERGRTLLIPELTYVGIALAALLGLLFTLVVRWIGRLLIPWAPEDNAPGQG